MIRICLQNCRFQKPFAMYPLHSMLRFIRLFVELYFISFQHILDPVMLKFWSNHYLKGLYRFQIIFENSPIYIGDALQRVISYLSNFSAFWNSICGGRWNEIWKKKIIASSVKGRQKSLRCPGVETNVFLKET